jgi:hypothetical protein
MLQWIHLQSNIEHPSRCKRDLGDAAIIFKIGNRSHCKKPLVPAKFENRMSGD